MCTSRSCAARSSPTLRGRATSSPSRVSGTAWSRLQRRSALEQQEDFRGILSPASGAGPTVVGVDRIGIAAMRPDCDRRPGELRLLASPQGAARRAAGSRHRAAGAAFTPQATAWRAAELTAPRNRLALARSIRRLVRCGGCPLPAGRCAAQPARGARRSGDAAGCSPTGSRHRRRPVAARGILLLDRLLTDGYGPLYVSYRAMELRGVLARAADDLEVRR